MDENSLKIDASEILKLSEPELFALTGVAQAKMDSFPHFCKWLSAITADEQVRRADPSLEVGMIELPEMNGEQLGECLVALYCFLHFPLTDGIYGFLDHVNRVFIGHAAGALGHFLNEVPV